jgi:hypothetical protein
MAIFKVVVQTGGSALGNDQMLHACKSSKALASRTLTQCIREMDF